MPIRGKARPAAPVKTTEDNSRAEAGEERLGAEDIPTSRLVLRLMRLAWKYRVSALRVIALQLVLLGMSLSGLGLSGLGIDVIHHGFDPSTKPPRWPFGLRPPDDWSTLRVLVMIALGVFLLALLRFVVTRAITVYKVLLVQEIVVDLRSRVYDKLQRLSFRFFDANESGSIINRVTGDVQAVRRFVDGVLMEVLVILLSLAFYLAYMLNIHVRLTIVCLATTPLLWFLTVRFSRIVKPAYRKNRELYDRAVLVLSENVQGVHVVKGFSRQKEEIEKFRAANDAVTEHKRWIFRRVSTFVPIVGLIPYVNLVILLIYGGYLWIHDPDFQFGSGLIVFAGLLGQFSGQVGGIARIANSVQISLTGAQRVFEVLDAPVTIRSPENPVPLGRARGSVRFEHVSFHYSGGSPALFDVSFSAEPGQTVAIVGATGSGKSTLMSLIPRFYDPDSGRVMIDDHDVREYDVNELRRNIGIVFQESFLFSTTVAANIAFGHPEASQEQIEKAARIAAAHEFILQLENGYDTLLSEGGANLSGGQRQRIAIARAILLEPPILLLDDPTAAIDPETEEEILRAMDNAMRGRTTFVIAHRLSTLRRADVILVLDRGRIVQMGTHEELMRAGGHYQHAASLQIADRESRRLLGMEESMR